MLHILNTFSSRNREEMEVVREEEKKKEDIKKKSKILDFFPNL